jgi:hypothetical protein
MVNAAVPLTVVFAFPGYEAFTVTVYGNEGNVPDCGVTTSAVPVLERVNKPVGTVAPPGVPPTVMVQVAVPVISTGFVWPEMVAMAV